MNPLQFLKKTFKNLLLVVFGLIAIVIIYLNLALYYQPSFIQDGKLNEDVLAQLQHLKGEMNKGAAYEMQKIYPEGFVFLNAIYALAWSNTLKKAYPSSDIFKQGLYEIDFAIKAIDSSEGQTPFSTLTDPALGAYYNGWLSYVIGSRLELRQSQDSLLINRYKSICDTIASALRRSSVPYLPSYPKSTWPADMSVCMASLALHDRVFTPKYQQDITKWLQQLTLYTDTLGLLPHYTDVQTGKALTHAQGASQSLILNFLWEIDTAFARSQFEVYREYFVEERLGLPGVREYPKGLQGEEHIDSGPVIWQIGGVASIVGQRVMTLYGEDDLAVGLRNSIEAFGAGYHHDEEKMYLFGQLPMADVFIAWVNSTAYDETHQPEASPFWRWKFQLLSITALFIIGWFMKKLR